MKYIVFDLDGTLANIDHRMHYIEGDTKDWKSFFEACDKDSLIYKTRQIGRALFLLEHHKVVILTGRSESVREKTENWLDEHDIRYEELIMRPEGDFRHDYIFKKEWAEKVGFENISMAFEDRQAVVDMWKNNGVFCFQVVNS